MPRCWIALGGNVGEVENSFERALDDLNAAPDLKIVALSHTFRTAPVGSASGATYLNAAAGLDTQLPPLDLLDRLQAQEARLGRVRTEHWAPRTLDLDLLLYGDEQLDSPRLTVPHPALWYRRFVLDPLAEIAADVVHPRKKLRIRELRQRLLARPLRCALAGLPVDRCGEISGALRSEFPDAELSTWLPTPAGQDPEPTLLVWFDGPSEPPAQVPATPYLPVNPIPLCSEQAVRDILAAALGR